MSDNGYVKLETKNGIAEITFFHPKSNSLPGDILRLLAGKVLEADSDSSAKVIVLKSAGEKAFCAGASFDELLEINDLETGKQFFSGFAGVINAIRKAKKFVIVRAQGKAVGGGVGLLSAADYAFGMKSSSVKLSEFALGIGPFVVGPAVERKIGKAAFSQMSIDYDWYDAEWAKSKGLFAEIFDCIEELDLAVSNFAKRLSENSPDATAELKRIFWEGAENWDTLLEERAEVSGRLVLSDYTRNYIKQFKNK